MTRSRTDCGNLLAALACSRSLTHRCAERQTDHDLPDTPGCRRPCLCEVPAALGGFAVRSNTIGKPASARFGFAARNPESRCAPDSLTPFTVSAVVYLGLFVVLVFSPSAPRSLPVIVCCSGGRDRVVRSRRLVSHSARPMPRSPIRRRKSRCQFRGAHVHKQHGRSFNPPRTRELCP